MRPQTQINRAEGSCPEAESIQIRKQMDCCLPVPTPACTTAENRSLLHSQQCWTCTKFPYHSPLGIIRPNQIDLHSTTARSIPRQEQDRSIDRWENTKQHDHNSVLAAARPRWELTTSKCMIVADTTNNEDQTRNKQVEIAHYKIWSDNLIWPWSQSSVSASIYRCMLRAWFATSS